MFANTSFSTRTVGASGSSPGCCVKSNGVAGGTVEAGVTGVAAGAGSSATQYTGSVVDFCALAAWHQPPANVAKAMRNFGECVDRMMGLLTMNPPRWVVNNEAQNIRAGRGGSARGSLPPNRDGGDPRTVPRGRTVLFFRIGRS